MWNAFLANLGIPRRFVTINSHNGRCLLPTASNGREIASAVPVLRSFPAFYSTAAGAYAGFGWVGTSASVDSSHVNKSPSNSSRLAELLLARSFRSP